MSAAATITEKPQLVLMMSGSQKRPLKRITSAPDGGWGYVVLLGMVVCFITTFGELSCLGLLFGDFLAQLGLQTSALTALPSCFYMSSSLVGAFANYLFARFSVRTVGMCGAVTFVAGSLAAVAAGSLNQLLLAYGLLQGIGFGVMLAVSYTMFNRYFVRRRVTMMGLAQTLLGVGNMGLPVAVQWLHDQFGYRGCMAMVAALNAHVLVGMLVMQPVRRHERVEWVERSVDDDADDKADGEQVKMLQSPAEQKLAVELAEVTDSRPRSAVWSRIVRFLDLGLCADYVYVNICCGMALTLYSDVAFFTILPVYLRELHFEKMQTAQVVSLCAAADLGGRFFLTLVSYVVQVRARVIFLAGVLGTMATRLVFQQCSDPLAVTIAATAIGFFRAWIHVPIAIVFADHLPAERFPSGYGLFMVVQGALIFLLGPVVGWVRDVTGSYTVTFHYLTTVLAVCAVPWSLEMFAASVAARRRTKSKANVSAVKV